jgi:RNA polymerase sigma-70 factor, ECF subfamily
VTRAADERARSFEEEALPHLDAVYRFALRLTGSPSEAEDLVQETYLRAYRAWDQYTPGTRAKSWLFTIGRNAYLRERERDARREELVAQAAREANTGGADLGETPLFAGRPDYDPEGDFFRNLVDDRIFQAIDSLPKEYREVVVLSDLEGLNYQEIADVVDAPLGTVKSRLFRGRRALQKTLYTLARDNGYIQERQ